MAQLKKPRKEPMAKLSTEQNVKNRAEADAAQAAACAAAGVPVTGHTVDYKSTKTGFRIDILPHAARRLLTIDWDTKWDPEDARDAFVRLRPPATATDEQVEKVRQDVVLAGCKAVRVLPRPRGEVLTQEAKSAPRTRETLREACLSLVETVATRDREKLREEVESVLVRVGL